MASTDSKLFKFAIQLAKQAVVADQGNRTREAIEKYTRAAEILLEFLKFNKNPRLRALCEEKIQEYINRANMLKGVRGRSKGTGGGVHSGGAPASEPGSGPVGGRPDLSQPEGENLDEDEARLRASIAETIIAEVPDVTWDDIAGLADAKQALREAIVLPILQPKIFTGGRQPWSGILLYGPPGTGKTMLAKAAAHECGSTFFVADSASLTSKWLGESEKLIKELFRLARQNAPSIIFMDEIDSIATSRGQQSEGGGERRMKTQLLGEMQGVRGKEGRIVVVMGATNRPWDIDTAVLRRFEKRIYIGLPDAEAREAIFKIHSRGVSLGSDVDFRELGRISEGYSGSDIATVCREALMMPVRELDLSGKISAGAEIVVRPVTMEDFRAALASVRPVVKEKDLRRFEDWAQESGSV
ncbi:MAG: hypothetical protein Kow0069_27710 [Promethearchaeota archaeon]